MLGTTLNEENFSLEFFSSFLKLFVSFRIFVIGEEDKSLATLTEDRVNEFIRECDDSGEGGVSNKLGNSFLAVLTFEADGTLVKLTEDSDAGVADFVLFGTFTIRLKERLVIGMGGSLEESIIETTFLLTEVDNIDLVGLDLLVKCEAVDLFGGRAGLLVDPSDNRVSGAATSVFLSLTINKPIEGGETFNLV